MKKQPEITAQTKQNLIDAFWSLYCEKRIDKITVREITMKSGYNRSTFYEYFLDVYDVLEQIEDSLLPDPAKMPPLNAQNIPNDAQPFSVDQFFKMYEQHNKYFTVLLGDKGDPAFQSKMKNSIKPKLKEALIAKGAKDDFQLDYTLEYNISALYGILSYWFSGQEKPSAEDFLALMYELSDCGAKEIIEKLCNT